MLNLKVILGGIVFALLVFAFFVAALWAAKATDSNPVPATAILKVIEAPTPTPIAPKQTPTSVITPGLEPTASANISLGNYVQVSGTGGDGLRLHESASVASKVRFIALESEVFIVKDGPVEADGYIWWYLQDPYSENAAGWGVANYLAVVQNP
ncbi:MAG: hypothetical protein C3F13_11780 [Anaerolineales bacterium]|nr:MAG: hypothetical protein C3F13_11780 [Anaerolineales bacterium]